jgi:hypothetical protein
VIPGPFIWVLLDLAESALVFARELNQFGVLSNAPDLVSHSTSSDVFEACLVSLHDLPLVSGPVARPPSKYPPRHRGGRVAVVDPFEAHTLSDIIRFLRVHITVGGIF